MADHQPLLHVFEISHFCEKARWSLDRLGIAYRISYLVPGLHRRVASRIGARGSSLPILQVRNRTVQGSAAIIDWAEAHKLPQLRSLTPDHPAAVLKLEKHMDQVLGTHVRRYFYSEALLDYPHTVLPLFARHLDRTQSILLTALWPYVRKKMIRAMDLGLSQGLQSRERVADELDRLDKLLADGRPFLDGDHFSRGDITAASLLAPLVKPPEHPAYDGLVWPPNFTLDCDGWRQRPSLIWVQGIYSQYRQPL